MDLPDIKINDVLRNPLNGKAGVVRKIEGRKIHVAVPGEKELVIYTFTPEFTRVKEPMASVLRETLAHTIRIERSGLGSRRRRLDEPSDIRAQLTEYADHLHKKHPKAAKSFDSFWKQVLALIGDEPGLTWQMRNSKQFWLNPVIRTRSKDLASTNWVDLVHVFADAQEGAALQLVIIKAFLPERFAHLFPKKKAFYTAGAMAQLPHDSFDAVKNQYLACFADILGKRIELK